MSGPTINPGTQGSWGMQCWIWLSNKFERGTKINRLDENPKNSIIIYTTEDGLTKIDATFDGDTVWLSIDQMAELFQRDKSTISRHIKNIFTEGELNRDSVVVNFATTAADGKTYQVDLLQP